MQVEFHGRTYETVPVEPLKRTGLNPPPATGFWGRFPSHLRWSYIKETEGDPTIRYAAGIIGRVLCRGEAPTWKAARKKLEREQEQAAILFFRRMK